MQKNIFILLILLMSCTTEPVDQHDDNAILQSFLKIGDKDKIILYDIDGNGTVDCRELPDDTIEDSLFCVLVDDRITKLNLYNMGLSGPIPESIGGLDQLVMLGLSSNKLVGEIPESIGNLAKLGQLNLSNNQLSGSIPESIGKLKGLWNLNLENNQLSGSIPDAIASLPILISFLLNNNQLSLAITDIICNRYSDLDTLNIAGNQFCPPFPSCIDSPGIIGQQECQGLGCEDDYTAINSYCYANSDLDVLDSLIYNNHPESLHMDADASGKIDPLELGQQVWYAGRLERLDCYWETDSCNLSGKMPAHIGMLDKLEILDLHDNQLTGGIPSSIVNLANLKELKLNNNNITGDIPEKIGDLSNLKTLSLDNNQLSGGIPDSIGDLTNLITLHLHGNQLSGQIPEGICDLSLNWAIDSTNESKSYIFNNQLCTDPATDEWPSCIADYVGIQYTDNCPTGSE